MTTHTTTWCDCCQLGNGDWQTEQRTKTGTFSTTVYCQSLCLDCLCEKWLTVGKGDLWGMRYKLAGHDVMWNQKGDF